jgi:hypothetical protein
MSISKHVWPSLAVLLAVSSFFLLLAPRVANAQGGSVAVNGADYVANNTLSGSQSLIALMQNVTARIIVEYADYASEPTLQPPQGLNLTLAERIIVEYADYAVSFRLHVAYDINNDGKVEMKDIGIAAKAFDSTPGSPRWNMVADLNGDSFVDMKDIGIVSRHFGETYPTGPDP